MPTASEKKEREQVSQMLEKIEQHEKAIAQLLSHSQRDREKRSLSQAAPKESEKIQKVQVKYRNTFVGDIEVRTRKQAVGPSAQHCSRRHLKHLLPDSRDFDIQNACFSLLSQLIEKMCPCSPIPSEIAETLQELAVNRDECVAKLGLTKAEGKQLLLEVFNGSHLLPPWDTHDLLKMVQRASIYCRWLACGTLQDIYAKCSREPSRRQPDVSALFFLWSAAEDFVLQAWVEYLTTLRPRHLSLHYDGIRIDNLAVHGSFIADSQEYIQEKTGFRVCIVEKAHDLFVEAICKEAVTADVLDGIPPDLLKGGCCILCAIHHCLDDDGKVKVAEVAKQGQEVHGISYRQAAGATGISLLPQRSLNSIQTGRYYLLHAGQDGQAHCVALYMPREECNVVVFNKNRRFVLEKAAFRSCTLTCIDSTELVLFAVGSEASTAADGASILDKALSGLLDLQAGAEQFDEDSEEHGPMEESIEETISPGKDLLRKLDGEVRVVIQERFLKENGRWRCPLCPFRAFGNRQQRVADHVAKYHKLSNNCCASGTKQLKVIMALHDHDVFNNRDGRNYLQRSADLLRHSVVPALAANVSEIDRHIRLVYAATGPEYRNLQLLASDEDLCRRVRNIYYTRGFAHMVYMELLMCDAKVACLCYLFWRWLLLALF